MTKKYHLDKTKIISCFLATTITAGSIYAISEEIKKGKTTNYPINEDQNITEIKMPEYEANVFIFDQELQENATTLSITQKEIVNRTIGIAPQEITLENKSEEQKLIETYANYYCIDKNVAYNLAVQLTNNFTSEEYLNTYNIGNTKMNQKENTFNSKEAGIIAFVRNLYQLPSTFGLTQEEVLVPYDNWPYEPSNLTQQQFIGHVADLMQVSKELCLAINYSEMEDLRVYGQIPKNNNYGNWRAKKEFFTFISPEAGMIEHVILLKGMLNEMNVTPEEFIVNSGLYTLGEKGAHDYTWERNVTYYYNYFKENGEIFEISLENPEKSLYN